MAAASSPSPPSPSLLCSSSLTPLPLFPAPSLLLPLLLSPTPLWLLVSFVCMLHAFLQHLITNIFKHSLKLKDHSIYSLNPIISHLYFHPAYTYWPFIYLGGMPWVCMRSEDNLRVSVLSSFHGVLGSNSGYRFGGRASLSTEHLAGPWVFCLFVFFLTVKLGQNNYLAVFFNVIIFLKCQVQKYTSTHL